MTIHGSAPSTRLVELRDISRFYPPTTVALSHVSADIRVGESVAIVGPSGSGKSTLLAILGLLDSATSGSYVLFGQDVGALTDAARTRQRRQNLGFIFQAFHLIPHFTAQENVEYALRIAGVGHAAARERAAYELDRIGLSHRIGSLPTELSGGEQQRVAIARAVAREPRLLLCDEPTGNLDTANSDRVLELLFALVSDATALVIVTHDLGIAARCERRLRVTDGTVIETQ